MTKYFRFTVELKANVLDNPKDVECQKASEEVRRLAQKFAADEEQLVEVYKVIFFDLLFGDNYSEEILQKAKQKDEKELFLSVASQMVPQDSDFFTKLFSDSAKGDADDEKDNVLNLFYSYFEKPKIAQVSFERFEKNDKDIERNK